MPALRTSTAMMRPIRPSAFVQHPTSAVTEQDILSSPSRPSFAGEQEEEDTSEPRQEGAFEYLSKHSRNTGNGQSLPLTANQRATQRKNRRISLRIQHPKVASAQASGTTEVHGDLTVIISETSKVEQDVGSPRGRATAAASAAVAAAAAAEAECETAWKLRSALRDDARQLFESTWNEAEPHNTLINITVNALLSFGNLPSSAWKNES